METAALIRTEPLTVLQQVGQKEEDAPSRKRQQPGSSGRSINLPEDLVTLSDSARPEQQTQPSQPVTPREKAALLALQTVPRFSVYG